ncbi:MAG: M23 family metallopeptidase [Crocinitomicaceae bacterium]
MKSNLVLIVVIISILSSCRSLPSSLSQASITEIGYEVLNDSLIFKFENPLHCPLRISAQTSNSEVQDIIESGFPITIEPKQDTLITYLTEIPLEEVSISFSAMMGDSDDSVLKREITLPFKEGNKYQVVQGYNGSFSHDTEYSRYAIDFNLKEGDTICASKEGYVVGVIEGYAEGGKSKRWSPYANYITIFHPEMNLYTQYVHLAYKGSFVEVGDYVQSNQEIGLSGKTGRTDIEHLHFNVLIPNINGMESTAIEFLEGYKGVNLKRGNWVEK